MKTIKTKNTVLLTNGSLLMPNSVLAFVMNHTVYAGKTIAFEQLKESDYDTIDLLIKPNPMVPNEHTVVLNGQVVAYITANDLNVKAGPTGNIYMQDKENDPLVVISGNKTVLELDCLDNDEIDANVLMTEVIQNIAEID